MLNRSITVAASTSRCIARFCTNNLNVSVWCVWTFWDYYRSHFDTTKSGTASEFQPRGTLAPETRKCHGNVGDARNSCYTPGGSFSGCLWKFRIFLAQHFPVRTWDTWEWMLLSNGWLSVRDFATAAIARVCRLAGVLGQLQCPATMVLWERPYNDLPYNVLLGHCWSNCHWWFAL